MRTAGRWSAEHVASAIAPGFRAGPANASSIHWRTNGNGSSGAGSGSSVTGVKARSGKRSGVELEVLCNESGDEKVAVIVAGSAAQSQRLARFSARRGQLVRLQLLEERIRRALIDEQLVAARRRSDRLGRIPFAPRGFVRA